MRDPGSHQAPGRSPAASAPAVPQTPDQLRNAGLDTAEGAGLVHLNGSGVEFRHPLLRAAVYHGATRSARRAAHRALAAAFQQFGDADRAAWQLAAASDTPDQHVAAALEETGLRAQARGGYGAAARALHRAAFLSPNPRQRNRRLQASAEASWFAGRLDEAVHMLDEAPSASLTIEERANLQHLRGRIETWRGNMPAAQQLLLTEGEAIATADPEKAALMLIDAAFPLVATGNHMDALMAAQRAQALAAECGKAVQAYARLALGMTLILCGQAPEGYPQMLSARSDLEREDPVLLNTAGGQFCSQASIWVEDWSQARRTLSATVNAARAQSAPGMFLPYNLGSLSELD